MKENTKDIISATATPLASIFGSGFLVIVPILNGAVGPYAWLAMACVCGLAYAVGSVIRFNIRNAEPLLEAGTASQRAVFFERSSDLALVIAYAISVCLYIRHCFSNSCARIHHPLCSAGGISYNQKQYFFLG